MLIHAPPVFGLITAVSMLTGCAGCGGTGGRLVPLTPDPPMPVAISICDSDIHLKNDSEQDLHGMIVSVRSILSGIHYTRAIGKLEKKGDILLPAAETGWLLAEGEVLTVEADGHSPTRFPVHLSASGGR